MFPNWALVAWLAGALSLSAGASAAWAQATVRWSDGISIESDDGSAKLQLGGLLQIDGRFLVGDSTHAPADTFLVRRARPIVQGRASRYFEFRLMPDFGLGSVVLFDAYVDTKLSDAFRIRVGKDKTPIGLEQLYADYSLLFPERTLATNLVPNRDVGVQAQGSVAGGRFSYVAAIFNGALDGSTSLDADANDGKDVVGRATLRLGALGLAAGGSAGREAGALPSFRTAGQQIFFSYAGGVVADGDRRRISPSAFYFYKALGAFAEFVRSAQEVANGSVRAEIANTAWEVTASFVATGEKATDRGVLPNRPFDPGRRQWGALQIAGRISHLSVDPKAFSLGLANQGASRRADALGLEATWYANRYVKEVVSFERTVFDGDANGKRKPEHAVVFRVQFNFQPTL